MPPKKKLKDTRASTDVFLVGQPRSTPMTVTKPLTNGDMVRYLHWRKGLEDNMSADWESLFCCPLKKGTSEANCFINGCQSRGVEVDVCGVFFAKHTGGWLKTGLPLKSDQSIKTQIRGILKDWQAINKKSTRLSLPDLSVQQKGLVEAFQMKMSETFLITDRKAEELVQKDKLRNKEQKEEDIAFLESMKDDRKATLSTIDNIYQKKVDSKVKRQDDEQKRKEEYNQTKEIKSTVVDDEPGEFIDDDGDHDEDFVDMNANKRKNKDKTVTIEVPKNIVEILAPTV